MQAKWTYNAKGLGTQEYSEEVSKFLEEAYVLGEKSILELPVRGPLGERFEINFKTSYQINVQTLKQRRVHRNGKLLCWPPPADEKLWTKPPRLPVPDVASEVINLLD